MRRAIELAKWFIKGGYDDPRDTFNGNMKLQKLLYFAQLIHLAKYDTELFGDPILAFKHGSVVESVRLEYKNNLSHLIQDAELTTFDFREDEMNTLTLTAEIFGDASADELSKLNHVHRCWQEAYKTSYENGFHVKDLARITTDALRKYAVDDIKEVLYAFESSDDSEECIEIKGVKFYYNPTEIQLNENLLSYLRTFPADETAYSMCYDEAQGLIIY